MKITIRQPIGYSQIGRKDQQEDAVWPAFADVTPTNRCIVLCDGVGGSAHGEIASQTASKVIGERLTERIREKGVVTDADVRDAVSLAHDELDRIDTQDPADNGQPSMATTMTAVCIHDEGILAAHMGDSRIYLVRPGQGLLYQSSDHSLVNALLQVGEITPEEAKTFPRKNVITKAIQPHASRRHTAEVHQLTDIRPGDYIFMCCDGVLEQLTNDRLVEILSMDCPDAEKLALLEAESTDRTKDNYTAYLIPIDNVEGSSSIVNDDEVSAVAVEQSSPVTNAQLAPATQHLPDKRNKKIKGVARIALSAMGIVAMALLVFFLGRYSVKWFNIDDGISETTEEQSPTELTDQSPEITDDGLPVVVDSEPGKSDSPSESKDESGVDVKDAEGAEDANPTMSAEKPDVTKATETTSETKEMESSTKQKE